VTGCGVFAMDVDGTVIGLDDDTGAEFARTLAPLLVKVSSLRAHVALIAGNSAERLAPRLIAPLVRELSEDASRVELNTVGELPFPG